MKLNPPHTQNRVTLSPLCRNLSIVACIILTIENLILFILSDFGEPLFGSPGYGEALSFIINTPIDVLAFILFGIAVVYEYYQNRIPVFLCIGLLFFCWGILTVIWRIMTTLPRTESVSLQDPVWVILKPLIIPIIIFIVAAILLTLIFGLMIITLDRVTREGLVINQLHPKSRSVFRVVSYLYLGTHTLFSLVVFLAFLPPIGYILALPTAFYQQTSILILVGLLAFLAKLMVVPILGTFFYILIAALYFSKRKN